MSQTPDSTSSGWGAPSQPPTWGSPAGGDWASPSQVPAPGPAAPPAPYPASAPGGPGTVHAPPAPTYGPTPPAGWRPPALQPGIVPLRPLGLGEILDGAMKAIRFNPQVMFGLAAAIVTAAVVFTTLVGQYLSGFILSEFTEAMGETPGDPGTDATMSMLLSTYGIEIVVGFLSPVLTGLLIVAVSRAVIGQKVSVGQTARSKRVWAVLGFTLLLGLAQAVVLAAVIFVIVLLGVSVGGSGGVALSLALGLLAAAGMLVGWFWVLVRTLLVPPALMLEGKRFWPTITRAWRLTRGSFWRLLGIYLLVWIMMSVVVSIITFPGAIIASVLAVLEIGWASLLVLGITMILAYTLTITYQSAIIALLYIDVRMRREGLDLELARAAEATA